MQVPVLVDLSQYVFVTALEVPEVAFSQTYESSPLLTLGEQLVILFELFSFHVTLEHPSKCSSPGRDLVLVVVGKRNTKVQVAEDEKMGSVIEGRRVLERSSGYGWEEQGADDVVPVPDPVFEQVFMGGQMRANKSVGR
jgi:hypothetical protein